MRHEKKCDVGTLMLPPKHNRQMSKQHMTETFELDIHAPNFHQSSIYKAIKEKDPHGLSSAIRGGCSVHTVEDEFQLTYLHLLVFTADGTTERTFIPMVYSLSNSGIRIDAMDYRGRTALYHAAEKGLHDIMLALLRCGAVPEDEIVEVIRANGGPFEYELMSTFLKFKPGISMAVQKGDLKTTQRLVSYWVRVNSKHDGKHLLEIAKETKNAELCQFLESKLTTTELAHAVLAGDIKLAQKLLRFGNCDINTMDMAYRENYLKAYTPRSLRDTAQDLGHIDLVRILPVVNYSKDGDDNIISRNNEDAHPNMKPGTTTSAACILL
ncbi:uncharacterized protein LOC106176362 [Lingula anatina]|uniref:Uncharacterized protein LOC106176362 n=1 Tax=Lingula anatina TaxID=7574 RepID=A0A1S3JVS8_LINAN|nr:uncharacterized protein LOC106176362 [Lingula anatina]XP_013414171.1 uncharacterized protein LOC106176362 [Lingula anatina]|eukprot:XP_013414170.1 uncharacterized protein LOC106176362 [Lingula anatina]